YDPDLGLYYLRNRYYNPVTGRFMTQDSFEGFNTQPLSLHKYTYAHNDPVNKKDPTGRFAVDAAIGNIFNTAFATAAVFGNRNTAGRTFAGSNRPYDFLFGDDYAQTSLAIFSAQVITQDQKCDKALIDFNVPSLRETSLGLDININVFDGRKSDLFSKPDNRSVGDILSAFTPPAVTWPRPISRNGDWPILLGKGFLESINNPSTGNRGNTAETRTLIILHESVHQRTHKNDDFFKGSMQLTFAIGSKCFPGKTFPGFYPPQ
ncbi:MAG: RHS repeat-associated core domain-containing protein, partial [Acidobacteriota bacterium]